MQSSNRAALIAILLADTKAISDNIGSDFAAIASGGVWQRKPVAEGETRDAGQWSRGRRAVQGVLPDAAVRGLQARRSERGGARRRRRHAHERLRQKLHPALHTCRRIGPRAGYRFFS